MNLDDLLSKYLDGDLSHEEDEQLRSLLAEDNDAKEEFDAAVLLNAAIKEDAESIKAPAAVLRDTEDKIAMAIMSRRDTGVVAFYRRRKYYSYAAVFLLFLIGTIYRIYDSYPFDKTGIMAESMADLKTQMLSQQFEDELNQFSMTTPKEKYQTVKQVSNASSIKKTNEYKSPVDYAMSSSKPESSISNMSVFAPVEAFTEKFATEPTTTEFYTQDKFAVDNENMVNTSYLPKLPSAPVNPYMQRSIGQYNAFAPSHRGALSGNIPFYDFYQNTNNIMVTSFLGTEVLNNGIETNKNIAVSHISQSIAYALNNDNAIGVEVGISQYNYDEIGSISYTVERFERIDNGMEVENYNHGSLITETIIYDRKKEVLWASAFYERQKIFSDHFTINGRLGVGANSEGPLGYTRLYGKIGLFKGLYMTAGMEGRLFYLNLPELTTSDPKMRSSLILSYGLQFIF
jgi:hypothetical protein